MQINDCIVAATGGPTIEEGLATYYAKTVDETLNDAEYRWLGEQGAPGSLNDRWHEFLSALGLSGDIDDMQHFFWCDMGGVIPTPPLNVVTHLGVPVIYKGAYVTHGA